MPYVPIVVKFVVFIELQPNFWNLWLLNIWFGFYKVGRAYLPDIEILQKKAPVEFASQTLTSLTLSCTTPIEKRGFRLELFHSDGRAQKKVCSVEQTLNKHEDIKRERV